MPAASARCGVIDDIEYVASVGAQLAAEARARAEQQVRQLVEAGAEQAGDAEHLAGADLAATARAAFVPIRPSTAIAVACVLASGRSSSSCARRRPMIISTSSASEASAS